MPLSATWLIQFASIAMAWVTPGTSSTSVVTAMPFSAASLIVLPVIAITCRKTAPEPTAELSTRMPLPSTSVTWLPAIKPF